tara:strand:+ start:195 stop:986 length:792 start_codon:yes stop_codon:yes gene_type:complete
LRRFSEYKRCFTFGCSLTRYKWPTWSDIIKQDIPETYNYGKSGAGNLYISNQLVEANLTHNFNKNDLVIVMWSSVTREDRYKKNHWVTSGNITTQNNISAKFVHDWFDYRFYLLRDLALIELTRHYMKQSNAEFYMLNMAPFEIDDMISFNLTPEMKNSDYGDIKRVYAPTLESMQPDILTAIFDGSWPTTPIAGSKGQGQTADYHPRPEHHLKYIAKCFPNHLISKDMREFALSTNKKVLKASSFDDLEVWWKEHANKPGRL